MENKEKNNGRNYDEISNSMRAEGKNRKNNGTKKSNRLWLWFGVIVLIFILFWWLAAIGTFEDLIGVTNG